MRLCLTITVIMASAGLSQPALGSEISDLVGSIESHYVVLQNAMLRGSTRSTHMLPNSNSKKSVTTEFQCISDGNRVVHDRYSWETTDTTNIAANKVRRYELWTGNKLYDFAGSTGDRDRAKLSIDSNLENAADPLPTYTLGDAFWRGMLRLDRNSLPAILRDNIESIVYDQSIEEFVDDVACYRLNLDSSEGKRTFWIAKDFDSNIMKVEVEYGPGDSYNGSSLTAGQLNSTTCEVEELMQVDGHWLPKSVRTHEKISLEDGTVLADDWYDTTCQEAVLNPDYDQLECFTPDIPDGVPVMIVGYPHAADVAFQWDANKKETRAVVNSRLIDSVNVEATAYAADIVRGIEGTADRALGAGMEVVQFDDDAIRDEKSVPLAIMVFFWIGAVTFLILGVIVVRTSRSRNEGA